MKTQNELLTTIHQIVSDAKASGMPEQLFDVHIVSQADPSIQYLYWEFWEMAEDIGDVDSIVRAEVEGR